MSTDKSIFRRTGLLAAFLACLCCSSPAASADESMAKPADSLRTAQAMVERGENCAAAFGLAVRQFDENTPLNMASTAEVFRVLSVVSRYGGDPGTASLFADAASRLADSVLDTDDPARAPFLLANALATRLSGRPGSKALAGALVEEGLQVLPEGSRDRVVRADLLQARANLSRAHRDFATAREQYASALELRSSEGGEHDIATANNECWLANARLLNGDVDGAEELFLECQSDLRDLGLPHHPLVATVLSHLAAIDERHGNRAQAIDRLREADQELRRARDQIFAGFSQRRLQSPMLYSIAQLQLAAGEPEDAWLTFLRATPDAGDTAVALRRARAEQPAFAQRVSSALEDTAHSYGAAHAAILELRQSTKIGAPPEEAIHTLIQYARKVATSQELQHELNRDFSSTTIPELDLEWVQTRLQPDQALIGYMSAPVHEAGGSRTETHAVVIRHEGTPQWVLLSARSQEDQERHREDERRYSALLRAASEWPTRLPDDPEVERLLHGLYEYYFEPLEPWLKGTREVLFLATALSPGLPFPALVDGKGQALVERFSFRHLIGIDDLVASTREASTTPSPSLVLGDPAYRKGPDPEPTTDPTLDQALSTYASTVLPRSVVTGVLEEGVDGLGRLPRLTNSGWEARGIASVIPDAFVLTGKAATEQSLRDALGGKQTRPFHWIHLATHALVHPVIPERSALALSPRDREGLLYVEEIGFGWNIDCDLVTLSGCQTGGGPSSSWSGPLGFIQALHGAGARTLLLSTGKVDDVATALLMERFYANLSGTSSPRVEPGPEAPMGYAEALADAQRWLKALEAPDGRRLFAHPVYWAGFRVHGEGAWDSRPGRSFPHPPGVPTASSH